MHAKNRMFGKMKALLVAICFSIAPMAVLSSTITGCAGMRPVQTAETKEQKLFAAYGSWVVITEVAAKTVNDPSTPRAVQVAIKEVDQVSYEFDLVARDAYDVYRKAEEAVVKALNGDPSEVQGKIEAARVARDSLMIALERAPEFLARMRQAMKGN